MTRPRPRTRGAAAAPPDAQARIRTLVFDFYDRVRRDDVLGPVFERHLAGHWDAHLERMCDFWSTVLHATGRFRGDPLGAHARLPGIDAHHFDRWLELFEETADEVLPELEATDVVARAHRMRSILERAIQVRAEADVDVDA